MVSLEPPPEELLFPEPVSRAEFQRIQSSLAQLDSETVGCQVKKTRKTSSSEQSRGVLGSCAEWWAVLSPGKSAPLLLLVCRPICFVCARSTLCEAARFLFHQNCLLW